jgi:hypothetical protein
VSTPFSPEAAPAAGAEPAGAPEGAPPAGAEGQGAAPEGQAPAGADPRVLEQMQQQMQQFGGVIGQMAEYMPAMQQLAQQQGGTPSGEPTLEEMAAQFFGDPGYGEPGQQGQQFDPYTGEPVQQQPRFDPYTGEPLQPQGQPQQAGLQGNPDELVGLLRRVVAEEVAPFQQERQQEQWNALYQEFPQFNNPETAPQIADSVARAARLFGGDDGGARKLANNPAFARWAYLASVNEAQARGEIPAGATDGLNPIEAAGGASAPGGSEVDPGDAIVNAGRNGAGAAAGSHFR